MNYTTIPKSICQLQTSNGKPTDIPRFFGEEFFETKKVVYTPR